MSHHRQAEEMVKIKKKCSELGIFQKYILTEIKNWNPTHKKTIIYFFHMNDFFHRNCFVSWVLFIEREIMKPPPTT